MTARPFVTTFYSYKGGVGRTTLAANVAVALAHVGKTLLWDLDIEAPGLEHITALKTGKPIKRGYFGALVEWQKAQCPPKLDKSLLKAWDAALCAVQAQPGLFLLPAAPDAKSQVRDYIELDWAGFFGREPEKGLSLFDALLAHWADAGFEFVVIDSRTGITDLGALLTALVPDVTVLVGNFGVQNVSGLRLAWQALQPATGEMPKRVERGLEPLVRELVASPIPELDAQRRAAGYAIWEKHFGLRPSEWIEIPENEALRFSEAIALLEYPQDHPLVPKYQGVARRILSARERREEALREDASASALYPELMKPRGGLLRPGERGREAQERGRRFEDQVAHVLQLLRHTVERETLVDANRIDLIATTSGTLEDVTWFVECKETSVTKDMVDKLAMWVQDPQARARNARAMIVGRSFAPAALQQARNRGVQCFTLPQLEERLFNFKPYLAQLRASFEQSRLAECYVSQYVKRNRTSSDDADDSANQREELLPLAVDWATGKGRPLWVLLGDYGTGKTAFTQRFAYELARRCETEPATPVPLLINLRDYPNATSLETVIDEHLARTGQERGRAGAILHLVAQGRCVLLLDSFDEMGLAAVGVSVEEQFRQLARPTADVRMPAGGRVLVTCREEFFKERKEAEATVNGSGDRLARPGSALEQAAKAFDAQMDALPYFDHEQIREYLEKRLGEEKAGEALERIDSIHGLSDLATRPQLLEIVLESLPDLVAQGKAVSPGVLYYTYVNRWLNRHRPVGARLSVGQIIQLLELLAQTLWARGAAPLHYSELAKVVHGYQAVFPQIDPVHVDLELRTAAFLTRTPEGLYRFSHRSFLEFFYACRLLRLAQENNEADILDALSNKPLRIEVVRLFVDLWQGNDHERPCALTARLLAKEQAPIAAANLLRLAWWTAEYMADEYDIKQEPQRWTNTRRAVCQNVLPKAPDKTYLIKTDLSELSLIGIPLTGAILDYAVLDRCNLAFSNLDGASLQHAQARGTNFTGASCRRMNAEGLNAIGGIWKEATLLDSGFSGAVLRNSDLRKSKIKSCIFRDADLSLSLFESCHKNSFKEANLSHASFLAGALPLLIKNNCFAPFWRELPRGALSAIAISPDENLIATGSSDGSVRFWDFLAGKEIRYFSKHEGKILSLAITPDKQRIIVGSKEGEIQSRSISDGRLLREFKHPSKSVNSIDISPDGVWLASGGDDGVVRLWNTINDAEMLELKGHEGGIGSLKFSADSKLLASGGGGDGDGKIRLWDYRGNKENRVLGNNVGWIGCIAFSGDGKWLAGGDDNGNVLLWNLDKENEYHFIDAHDDWISTLSFSIDGSLIISAGNDDDIKIWSVPDGAKVRHLENHFGRTVCIAQASEKARLVGGGDDGIARVWDLDAGQELWRFGDSGDSVTRIAFSQDGTKFAAGTYGVVHLWDAISGRKLNTFRFNFARPSYISISQDNARLAVACSGHGDFIFDASSGELLKTLPKGSICIAFSPDGKLIATGDVSGRIKLIEASSGKEIIQFENNEGRLGCAAFSPDGRLLVGGLIGANGGVVAWEVNSGKIVWRLDRGRNWIYDLALSSDGNLIVSGEMGGMVCLRSVETGQEIYRFSIPGDRSVLSVGFSPDNSQIIGCNDEGEIIIWNAFGERQLAEVRKQEEKSARLVIHRSGNIAVAGKAISLYPLAEFQKKEGKIPSWSYQIRITPTGDPVTLYPDGTHYGEGEALEWLEYAEYGLKPDGTPDPIPTLHRATDVPWLRRGPANEGGEKRK